MDNWAVSGSKLIDVINKQVPSLDSTVDLVIVLIGANDICGFSTPSQMTSSTLFTSQFQTLLNNIVAKTSPNVQILVLSIPNIYQLWSLFHSNSAATYVWNAASLCQTMLANPTSTAAADVTRRAQVAQYNIDLNTIMSTTCSSFTGGKCAFDNNLVYNLLFTTADIDTHDYFHPICSSPSYGQGALAKKVWNFMNNTLCYRPNTPVPSISPPKPTQKPTLTPTQKPTVKPSLRPTVKPSLMPTGKPA